MRRTLTFAFSATFAAAAAIRTHRRYASAEHTVVHAGAPTSPTRPSWWAEARQTVAAAQSSAVQALPKSLSAHTVHSASFASNNPFEDRHAILALSEDAEKGGDAFAMFGVYDGHSGHRASVFAAQHLFRFIGTALQFTADKGAWEGCKHNGVANALAEAFVAADNAFLDAAVASGHPKDGLPGACAVSAYVVGRHLYVAGAGDCRAVLGSFAPPSRAPQLMQDVDASRISTSCSGKGAPEGSSAPSTAVAIGPATLYATPLSEDQHGLAPLEVARIRAEHPSEWDAIFRGRVKGRLQPTRGLGDGKYKRAVFNDAMSESRRIPAPYAPPYTTAHPTVFHHKLTPEDDFLVLACDGLWDFFSTEEVVARVHQLRDEPNVATALVADVIAEAARPFAEYAHDPKPVARLVSLPSRKRRRLYDDTTIIVVFFDRDRITRICKASADGTRHANIFAGARAASSAPLQG